MVTSTLNPAEIAGVDLIKRQMAELGFPMWDASPEAVVATAARLYRLRKGKEDGERHPIS